MMATAPPAPSLNRDMRPALAVMDRCLALPVVAACSTFFFSMPLTTSGILYVLFMEKFGVSREAALWPRTIQTVTASIMGFAIGGLQRKMSIYSMIMIGAFVCPVAIVASAFVPNMAWMSVTFGLLYATSTLTFVTGIQQGYTKNLKAVLVADYLGTHLVAVSWGIIGLIALPLTFCEPVIVGVFRDSGGSYDNLYRMCAFLDIIAALVLSVQSGVDSRNRRRNKRTFPHA